MVAPAPGADTAHSGPAGSHGGVQSWPITIATTGAPDRLSVPEAARVAGAFVCTLRRQASSGLLPKTGGRASGSSGREFRREASVSHQGCPGPVWRCWRAQTVWTLAVPATLAAVILPIVPR